MRKKSTRLLSAALAVCMMLSVLPVMLSVLPVHCLPIDFFRPAHNRLRTTPSIPGSVRLSSCRYTSLSDN